MSSTNLVTLALPREYGWVMATAAGTCFLSFWHGVRVGGFRKAAGIIYPQPYADSANMSAASPEKKKQMYLFNCAQRAHGKAFGLSREMIARLGDLMARYTGNYIENHAPFVIAMLLAGLEYPVTATVMGVGWSISRVVYAVGYTKTDQESGKGRLMGAPFWLFQLGAFGLAAWSGIKTAM